MLTKETIKNLDKCDEVELKLIFMRLLLKKKISFSDLMETYVKYIEQENAKYKTRESMLANSIAVKYSSPKFSKEEFWRARDRLMLDKWFDNDFFKKYFSKISKKELEKQEKYIKENLGEQ